MQCYHTVATNRIGGRIGWCVGRSDIGGAMPSKAVASGEGFRTHSAIAYGKMERHHAVTTSRILFHKGGGVGTDIICGAMPGEIVTDILSLDAGIAIVDS